MGTMLAIGGMTLKEILVPHPHLSHSLATTHCSALLRHVFPAIIGSCPSSPKAIEKNEPELSPLEPTKITFLIRLIVSGILLP